MLYHLDALREASVRLPASRSNVLRELARIEALLAPLADLIAVGDPATADRLAGAGKAFVEVRPTSDAAYITALNSFAKTLNEGLASIDAPSCGTGTDFG
jgi:hypothetical protein